MADNPRDLPEGFNALSLSRRQLLTAAGGVVLAGTLAACGSSSSSSSSSSGGSAAAGTPKKGGNFRLGVTGGGSGDIIDGQSIVTKPDQARLVAGWETLLEYDKDYKLQQTGLAEEVTQDAPDVWTVRLRDGIEFHERQAADGRRRRLLDQPHPEPRGGPVRERRPGIDRPQADQEDGQPDGAAEAEAGGLDDRRPAGPVLQRHRPAGLQPQGQADRHRPLHAEELHPRPAERPQEQPQLLARGPISTR